MLPSVRCGATLRRATFAGCAALAGAWLTACATREVPTSFPRDAAASPDAKQAPAAPVGAALAEDPPLPGESTARWPGLDDGQSPTDGAADPHAHHHHHHGAQAPPKPQGDAADPHAHHRHGAQEPPKPQGEAPRHHGGPHVHGAQDQAPPHGGDHGGAR
jgi:hypothetical protein